MFVCWKTEAQKENKDALSLDKAIRKLWPNERDDEEKKENETKKKTDSEEETYIEEKKEDSEEAEEKKEEATALEEKKEEATGQEEKKEQPLPSHFRHSDFTLVQICCINPSKCTCIHALGEGADKSSAECAELSHMFVDVILVPKEELAKVSGFPSQKPTEREMWEWIKTHFDIGVCAVAFGVERAYVKQPNEIIERATFLVDQCPEDCAHSDFCFATMTKRRKKYEARGFKVQWGKAADYDRWKAERKKLECDVHVPNFRDVLGEEIEEAFTQLYTQDVALGLKLTVNAEVLRKVGGLLVIPPQKRFTHGWIHENRNLWGLSKS